MLPDLHPVVERILVLRGYRDFHEVLRFLHPALGDLEAPWRLPDMHLAVERLMRARRENERVLVYGDYDTDGITAAALLTTTLNQLGWQADVFLPHRVRDGYGLKLQPILEREPQLVVSVDCGIRAVQTAQRLQERGIDLIITDHHLPGDDFPPATAIVNPKLEPDQCFQHYAGVGIAYQLIRALCETQNAPLPPESLTYACLGTIADCVPLIGENRTLTKCGLDAVRTTQLPGLQTLIQNSGYPKVDSFVVSWHITPRINAAGRIDDPTIAYEMLTTYDPLKARESAFALSRLNAMRKTIQTELYEQHADKRIELGAFLVLTIPPEYAGVAGLIANKLVEDHNQNAFVYQLHDDHIKGSFRAANPYDLRPLYTALETIGLECGGHAQAGGCTVPTERLEDFFQILATTSLALFEEEEHPMELPIRIIDRKLAEAVWQLEPFGVGNPTPTFLTRNIELRYAQITRDNRSMKFRINNLPALYPNHHLNPITNGDTILFRFDNLHRVVVLKILDQPLDKGVGDVV